MPAGLYFLSQYFPFPCSTHLPESNNIYNDTIYSVPSMTLQPSSTVLCRSQHIAREIWVERTSFTGYKYHTVYRAFRIIGK